MDVVLVPASGGEVLYIGYFRELSALIAQRGSLEDVDESAILKVMARYATEPYLPPAT